VYQYVPQLSEIELDFLLMGPTCCPVSIFPATSPPTRFQAPYEDLVSEVTAKTNTPDLVTILAQLKSGHFNFVRELQNQVLQMLGVWRSVRPDVEAAAAVLQVRHHICHSSHTCLIRCALML
jgi:hypothetical protein